MMYEGEQQSSRATAAATTAAAAGAGSSSSRQQQQQEAAGSDANTAAVLHGMSMYIKVSWLPSNAQAHGHAGSGANNVMTP